MKSLNIIFLIGNLVFASSKAVEESTNSLPSFSLESGFYDGESIELQIKTSDPKSIVYYTLDGSLPNENSTIYEQPLILKDKSNDENVYSSHTDILPDNNFVPVVKVKKANVIRARAKLSDGEFTDVVSGTYFVGLNKTELYQNLPVISIITDPENLFDYEKGIYVTGKAYDDWLIDDKNNPRGNFNIRGRVSERPATIEYIPGNDSKVTFSQDIGIRIKGKATRNSYQKSFHITSREEYGKKNMNYELIPGNMRADGNGPITKYKTFNLRNGGNDSDFGKFRDMLLQDLIYNPYFETQQSDFVIGFVDGEYWGIYDIYEDYNDNYIENNYGIDNKNVIVIKSGGVESGEESDRSYYKDTINYLTSTDMSIPENYAKASQQFDMEGYVWYTAFYSYIECQDGWLQGGNWGMWRVREPDSSSPKADGKWRMMTFDTEFSTGLYGDGNNYLANSLSTALNETLHDTRLGSQITRSLVKSNEFKTKFINALCDMKNIHFAIERVMKAIDEKENRLHPLILDHSQRNGPDWCLWNPVQHFENQVNIMRTWLTGRHSVFLTNVQEVFGFKPAVKVTITSNDFQKGGFIINDLNEFSESYTGEYFRENVLYITAKITKGSKLKNWVMKGCKLVSNKKLTLGVYPKNGCTITINYK